MGVRAAFKAGYHRVVAYAPTGAGKTEIAKSVMLAVAARGRQAVFVVDRKEIIRQTVRRFEQAGIDCGVIQAENTRDIRRPVVVGSIQTIARRGLPDQDVGLIVIDEAHKTAASQQYHEFMRRNSALPMLGLSATPFVRGMGREHKELGGPLWQRLVVVATISELIEQNFLVDCEIYAPGEPDLTGVKVVKQADGSRDYQVQQLAEATNTPKLIGDIVDEWSRRAAGTQTIAFGVDIAHSKAIRDAFRKVGVEAEHIDAYTKEDERQEIISRFRRGEFPVLCNVSVLVEGFDSPAARTMIYARPTKSLARWIQAAGRILRPYEGKEFGLILDHSGVAKRLGFPTDDLPLRLDDGKPREAGEGVDDKPEDELPVKCPSCSFLKPPKTHKCPKCGFAPVKVAQVGGNEEELVRVKRATAEEKQRFYGELLMYAARRGKKEGWIGHTFFKRFKHWPRGLQHTPLEPSDHTVSFITAMNIRYVKGRARHAVGHH